MTRAYNFSPGPAMLPAEVLREAQEAFCEYGDLRASLLEVSHRGDAFARVCGEAEALLRELLAIPESHAVLFLPGGATAQMAALPLNLLGGRARAAYIITGHWSRRAYEEGRLYCDAHIAADSAGGGYTTLPAAADAPADAAYLHYADNETIHGVEFRAPPASPLPLAADMSSNILSRPIRAGDFALIYAAAQKNLAPAGVTVVIARADCLSPRADTPSVLNYEKQRRAASMHNTPPVFQIYMLLLMLRWIKARGGAPAMETASEERAAAVYGALDASAFYRAPVAAGARSRMNIPFFLPDAALTEMFLREAEDAGLIGLKGHRAAGGIRASMYNAMPLEGAQTLAAFMRDFEKRRG